MVIKNYQNDRRGPVPITGISTEDHKKVKIHNKSSFILNNSNNLLKKP
jgi:hypothetical protein